MKEKMIGLLEQISEILSGVSDVKSVLHIPRKKIDINTVDCFDSFEVELLSEALYYTVDYIVKTLKSSDYSTVLELTSEVENIVKSCEEILYLVNGTKEEHIGSNFFTHMVKEFSPDELWLVIRSQVLLLSFSVTFSSVGSIDQLVDSGNLAVRKSLLNYEDNVMHFYRGESNFNYKLLPSILRDVNRPKYGIFNYNYMKDLYKALDLETRFFKVFTDAKFYYEFYAFMQHSKEYSILIDFTKAHQIALSFATQIYSNPNIYNNTDAAIYDIAVPLENVISDITICENILRGLDIYISKDKLNATSTIRGKLLPYCTPKDFEVRAHMIDIETNDRMRYQQGCFLLLSKCVIIQGTILSPIKNPFLVKYRIPTASKKFIYQNIKKNMPWYDYEHLMNPYRFFNEAPL